MPQPAPAGGESACDGPSLLVVGIDGSETSLRALHYAFGLARRQHSIVLAVFSYAPIADIYASAASAWHTGEQLAAELSETVATLAAEHGVEAEFVRAQRDPVLTVIELASARRADAIIIGASKALSHKLFGSKAVRIVRRSRCPVVVVP